MPHRMTLWITLALLAAVFTLPTPAHAWEYSWTDSLDWQDGSSWFGQVAWRRASDNPTQPEPELLVRVSTTYDLNAIRRYTGNGRFLGQYEFEDMREGYGVAVHDNQVIAGITMRMQTDHSEWNNVLRLQLLPDLNPGTEPLWTSMVTAQLYPLNCQEVCVVAPPGEPVRYIGYGKAQLDIYTTRYTLARFTPSGLTQNAWNYDYSYGGLDAVEASPAGNLFVAGHYANRIDEITAWLESRQVNGALNWQTVFGDVNTTLVDMVPAPDVHSPGGAVVLTHAPPGTTTLYIVDPDGSERWSVALALGYPRALVALEDGSFVILVPLGGPNGSTMKLVHLDPGGDLIEESDTFVLRGVGDMALGPNEEIVVSGYQRHESIPFARVYQFPRPAALTAARESVAASNPPHRFHLSPVYPNPFNRTATVTLDLPSASPLTVTVYDLLGRPVRLLHNGPAAPGQHRLVLDARGLSSGSYLLRAETEDEAQVRRMLFLK